jgi:uncharacterized protein (TIGR02452 family)
VSAANDRLRAVAAETIEITSAGAYQTTAGHRVEIGAAVAEAVAETQLHLPDEPLAVGGPANGSPAIEVVNATTLAAGRALGPDAAALVFASARNPGGGFRTGAVSQEEDIARASALHACLESVPAFYQHHRADPDLRYSDRVIYSPGVPVFRDDTWRLLDEPYELSLLTAAAPNLGAIRRNQPEHVPSVPEVVRRRAVRVLEVAGAHGHRALVLGAWGCGVFGNDPATVADAFAQALRRVARFDRVVFAVLDRVPDTPTLRAFQEGLARV